MTRTTALGIMCKAPRPGLTKTRLARVVGPERAAALSACFLRDVAEAILALPEDLGRRGYGVYAPAGTEAELRALLPESFGLLLQEGADFGQVLAGAMRALIGLGRDTMVHDSAVLINSDSPTLPPALLVAAIERLREPGDRLVLGPASDGGYVLIGLKADHPELFEDIPWSTPDVLALTLIRANSIELPVALLPTWYDIDDAQTLQYLHDEIAGRPLPFVGGTDALAGGPASATRALLAGGP